jgi:hypothetical protein
MISFNEARAHGVLLPYNTVTPRYELYSHCTSGNNPLLIIISSVSQRLHAFGLHIPKQFIGH